MAQDPHALIAAYQHAWNTSNGDPAEILEFYTEDTDFSDYHLGQFHMDKTTLRAFFGFMQTACKDVEMRTRNLYGTTEHVTWETGMDFTLLEDVPDSPYKKGERARMLGVTLMGWNKEGKIVKQSDYYCWVKPEVQS